MNHFVIKATTMKSKISEFNDTYRFQYHINKKNIPIQLFIDSRDILHMILGIKALTDNSSFNEQELASEEILIRGLIFNKWLNNFQVLLPHEDEILYNINRYKSTITAVSTCEEDELWYYMNIITGIKFEELLNKTPTKVYHALKAKNNAQRLYVAKFLLDTLNWKDRLLYLYKNVYTSDNETYKYDSFINSDLFITLMQKGFLKLRPNSKEANIVDSLVLCTIKKKLENYRFDNTSNKLPVFYDSTGLFRQIISLTKLKEEFSFKYDDKNSISVIQGNDFFLLQAILREIEKSCPLISKSNRDDFEKLNFLIQKLNIKIEALQKMDITYLKELKEFIRTKFIKVFWINEKYESTVFIKKLKDKLNKKEVIKKVDDDLLSITSDIKNRVSQYSFFRNIFSSLFYSYKFIQEIFTENISNYYNTGDKLDIFKDYGLTRFSIYSKDCNELQVLIDDMFSNKSQKGIVYSAQLSKIGQYLSLGYTDPENVDQADLIIGIALLWILGKSDLIIEILTKLDYKYSYYCLAFFHAASLIKIKDGPENIDEIEKILNTVNSSHSSKYSFDNNYKTAIAASYIYYHMWEKNSETNFRKNLAISDIKYEPIKEDRFIVAAIKYAQIAITYLEKDQKFKMKEYRKNKYYYIINNYVYYITMGGGNEEFDSLEKYICELEELYTNYPQNWQYRFDDTLSLYYLRLALSVNNNKKLSREYLKLSSKYSEKAKKMVLTIEDKKIIEQTSHKINESIAKLNGNAT